MCGLVGVAGKIGDKEKKIYNRLLYMDVIRGPHSTGMMQLTAQGPEVFKKAVPAADFMEMGRYSQMLNSQSFLLMGHNRWATRGKVNSTNAHPFHHGKIIGAHNGTLKGQYLLPDHTKFDVDSDNLIYAIDTLGIEEAWNKMHGAAALTLFDEELNSLAFIRNDERPFSYYLTKDGETLFWASEWRMLVYVLNEYGIYPNKEAPIFELPINELHQWFLGEKVLGNPVVTPLAPYVPPVAKSFVKKTGSSGQSGTGGRTDQNRSNTQFQRKDDDIVPINRDGLADPSGYVVSKDLNDIQIGDMIEFWCIDDENTVHDNGMVLCMELNASFDVRVFPAKDQELRELLQTQPYYIWEGEVAAVNLKENYAVMLQKTIRYTEDTRCNQLSESEELKKEVDEVACFPGWPGKDLTRTEWHQAVHQGCTQCRATPTEEEAEYILWVDPLTYYCDQCVKTSSDWYNNDYPEVH